MIPELVVLGILNEKPRHGYEIKQIVTRQFETFAEIKSGSIYYLLGKLEKEGLIEPRKEQPGPYPPRHVYEITEVGKERYAEFLREALYAPDRPTFAFDVALCFARDLDYEEIIRAIVKRRERVGRYLDQLTGIDERYPDRKWGFNAKAIKSRARIILEGIQSWYDDLESEVTDLMKNEPGRRPDVPGVEDSLDLRESSLLDEAVVEER